jgi:hypothetical protein
VSPAFLPLGQKLPLLVQRHEHLVIIHRSLLHPQAIAHRAYKPWILSTTQCGKRWEVLLILSAQRPNASTPAITDWKWGCCSQMQARPCIWSYAAVCRREILRCEKYAGPGTKECLVLVEKTVSIGCPCCWGSEVPGARETGWGCQGTSRTEGVICWGSDENRGWWVKGE